MANTRAFIVMLALLLVALAGITSFLLLIVFALVNVSLIRIKRRSDRRFNRRIGWHQRRP